MFILNFLNDKMNTPTPYGWFHIMWLVISIVIIFTLYKLKDRYSEKQLKIVLAIYGIGSFILELLKQILWSYNFDDGTWDYTWYSAPFQLCTMPIYISLICLFMNKNKIRDSLLSFLAFYTILGGLVSMLIPNTLFVKDTLINIHTMYLHCGSFVLSIYLLMNEIKPTKENIINAFYVFLICVFIALSLDIIFYKTGIIGDETFNMFFISPYFPSTLPVFSMIYDKVPYLMFLIIYIVTIALGSIIVYGIDKIIEKR